MFVVILPSHLFFEECRQFVVSDVGRGSLWFIRKYLWIGVALRFYVATKWLSSIEFHVYDIMVILYICIQWTCINKLTWNIHTKHCSIWAFICSSSILYVIQIENFPSSRQANMFR